MYRRVDCALCIPHGMASQKLLYSKCVKMRAFKSEWDKMQLCVYRDRLYGVMKCDGFLRTTRHTRGIQKVRSLT